MCNLPAYAIMHGQYFQIHENSDIIDRCVLSNLVTLGETLSKALI